MSVGRESDDGLLLARYSLSCSCSCSCSFLSSPSWLSSSSAATTVEEPRPIRRRLRWPAEAQQGGATRPRHGLPGRFPAGGCRRLPAALVARCWLRLILLAAATFCPNTAELPGNRTARGGQRGRRQGRHVPAASGPQWCQDRPIFCKWGLHNGGAALDFWAVWHQETPCLASPPQARQPCSDDGSRYADGDIGGADDIIHR
mmetsp:Transcript_22027/g.56351  ORF Transcript_22027/g.56351 Transcript_22027/m.56351 type:complete len:202 (-) Transcript_22027:112-717(-)